MINKRSILFLVAVTTVIQLLSNLPLTVSFLAIPCRHHRHHRSVHPLSSASGGDYDDYEYTASPLAQELKNDLVTKVTEFIDQKERDGDAVIDFGVKGGELNNETRAPQKIDFYQISKGVGEKADEVIGICNKLAVEYNTTSSSSSSSNLVPTRFLGDKDNGDKSPLNGPSKLLFTTAADANFSKKSARGGAKAQNVVDASKGTITNVIDFESKEDGTEPLLKQLNVVIKAKAESDRRVSLQFKYAKAILTRFFFLKVKWSLFIPVPGPFITRIIVFLSRIFRFGKKGAKEVPKAFFDILYLDEDLRIHRTGEDNIFVQGRETWTLAKP
eukprot:CAMPEP_0113467850 /NCGR_PEP_ID=MMETSP0014_2-20120614/15035_1 /TAXON_ID=2857 /ORGANISM="Nitzschia sp." /LENGTH=328 /DNA_ID=CAMNT_0000360187 /DNA_START=21 /DNA_END=1004 /DNA_ORIENTATION=- /assembly_acc=CAM_ASM_000159